MRTEISFWWENKGRKYAGTITMKREHVMNMSEMGRDAFIVRFTPGGV